MHIATVRKPHMPGACHLQVDEANESSGLAMATPPKSEQHEHEGDDISSRAAREVVFIEKLSAAYKCEMPGKPASMKLDRYTLLMRPLWTDIIWQTSVDELGPLPVKSERHGYHYPLSFFRRALPTCEYELFERWHCLNDGYAVPARPCAPHQDEWRYFAISILFIRELEYMFSYIELTTS